MVDNWPNRKLNIGILSDSPFLCTGYSNQATQLSNILSAQGHDVFYFAHVYMGQPLAPGTTLEDGRKFNFHIIGGGREAYFKDLLPIYTKEYKLDILIVLLDTFMVYPWLTQLDLSPAKTVFWFPSDGGGGMPLGCENILRGMNKAVAMARFGKEQVEKVHGIPCEYIPHAIDKENYYPLSTEKRKELRQLWGVDGKFVVGSVFRNQGRKMADRTLKTFALFAKDNPDAVLLLHTDPEDNAQVFPIGSLIQRYGLQNRVLFTDMKYYKGWNYKDMHKVYNLMDVFLLTTSGEGFGIPTIEAQACGVPVAITDYTTSRELVRDTKGGVLIDLVGTKYDDNVEAHGAEILDGTLTGSWSVERGMCSIYDAARKLQYLKDNPEMMKQMSKDGRESILNKYCWDVTTKQWIKLINELGGMY